MKLRIQDNSLRFRLTRREVESLVKRGRVEAEVRFASDRALQYAVCSQQAAECISADYSPGGIFVFVPLQWVQAWAESDQVSLEAFGPIHLLVEKDFQCFHGTERRDPDAFANPSGGTASEHGTRLPTSQLVERRSQTLQPTVPGDYIQV